MSTDLESKEELLRPDDRKVLSILLGGAPVQRSVRSAIVVRGGDLEPHLLMTKLPGWGSEESGKENTCVFSDFRVGNSLFVNTNNWFLSLQFRYV